MPDKVSPFQSSVQEVSCRRLSQIEMNVIGQFTRLTCYQHAIVFSADHTKMNSRRFQIPRSSVFEKFPFSWRTSVDGRPKRRKRRFVVAG